MGRSQGIHRGPVDIEVGAAGDQQVGHPAGEGRVPEADVRLFARLVRAAAGKIEEIDAALAEVLAKDWPLEKLDPVLRALLRAAAAELMTPNDPPMRVVINEYLDVAHGFFAGDEPKFANGVLEALARRFRADEFARG